MPFTASAQGAATGLVGTIGVQVVNEDGAVVIAHTTADIIELVEGSGVYLWTCPSGPAAIGRYQVVWDNGSTSFAAEDLMVVAAPISTGGAAAPPYPTIGTVTEQAQQQQRAVRGRQFTAAYIFGLDDDALPDQYATVSVTIINAEGYVVVNDEPATLGAVDDMTQQATFSISAATTPQRDVFTCMWVTTIGGATVTQVSTIDVCDARLFPMNDYLQYPELASFSTAQLEQARFDAENRLEDECGRAFTGRLGSEEFLIEPDPHIRWDFGQVDDYGFYSHGDHSVGTLALRTPCVQAIRSITRKWVDPTDDTSGVATIDIDYAKLDEYTSTIHYSDQYGHGLRGDITVLFEHGQPAPDDRRICCMLARYRLLHGPLDQRATQMQVEGGGVVNLSTPGMFGSVFGIPELDVFIDRHSKRANGFISGGR
jgi:hypothetical protein